MDQQKLSSAAEWESWVVFVRKVFHETLLEQDKPASFPCVVVWDYDGEYFQLHFLYVYPFAAELGQQMVEMTKKLQGVDVSKTPSDAELDDYNALREAAYDLLGAVNYILEGN